MYCRGPVNTGEGSVVCVVSEQARMDATGDATSLEWFAIS